MNKPKRHPLTESRTGVLNHSYVAVSLHNVLLGIRNIKLFFSFCLNKKTPRNKASFVLTYNYVCNVGYFCRYVICALSFTTHQIIFAFYAGLSIHYEYTTTATHLRNPVTVTVTMCVMKITTGLAVTVIVTTTPLRMATVGKTEVSSAMMVGMVTRVTHTAQMSAMGIVIGMGSCNATNTSMVEIVQNSV